MTTLYFGRHGETALNKEKKLRSWIDEPLNDQGLQEAEAMKKVMADVLLDRMYSSDLIRAERTAAIIGKEHGLKPITRKWFRGIDYGELNGKKLADIQEELQRWNEIWETDPDKRVPGGESFTDFQDRNWDGLESILSHTDDGDKIMLVAHLRNALLFHAIATTGGLISGKDVHLMDGTKWAQDPGSISKFSWSDGKLNYIGMVKGKAQPEAKAMTS